MVKTISTVAELVSEYRRHNPKGHFFDPDTLAFFGEKISKMQYMGLTVIPDVYERNRRCHKIWSEENDSVLGTRWKLHYFDALTFDHVIPNASVNDSGEWVMLR